MSLCHVCACLCSPCTGQKKALASLELELQVVLSHLMWVLRKSSQCFDPLSHCPSSKLSYSLRLILSQSVSSQIFLLFCLKLLRLSLGVKCRFSALAFQAPHHLPYSSTHWLTFTPVPFILLFEPLRFLPPLCPSNLTLNSGIEQTFSPGTLFWPAFCRCYEDKGSVSFVGFGSARL